MLCGKAEQELTGVESAKEDKMCALTLSELRRMEKLELTIHDLCEKGARKPEHYLDILQAVNDGLQVEIVVPSVFLSPVEQFQGFIVYNEWLKGKHPEYVIPEEEMAAQHGKLAGLDPDGLLFYCHQADVVLTARLAWEHTCSYRQKTWKSKYVRFEDGYMKPADNEPDRPKGFYTMRRPLEDKEAIGKRFQDRQVTEVRQELGKDWGMGCEGIQFVGITHKHYPELMDGNKIPFINLPGLAISLHADGYFAGAPCLCFCGDELRLAYWHIDDRRYSSYGSGSLQ